jgi:hypothetical protein
MKLRTNTGEVYFNPPLISRVHLNPDHSSLTVHFVNGTHFISTAATEEERNLFAEFLVRVTEEHSGFIWNEDEVLNLKSALWIAISEEGPIQVRSGDNCPHSLHDQDAQRIRRVMEG